MRFLKGNQDTSRAPNNNKQPCSCQTSLRNLLFHLVQRISLHFKSPDLYLFSTTNAIPKSLLPFESQARFQSEEFGSYDYAPRLLSLVACSLSSLSAHAHAKKTPVVTKKFLEVSRCKRAKHQERNVQKKCASKAKLPFCKQAVSEIHEEGDEGRIGSFNR